MIKIIKIVIILVICVFISSCDRVFMALITNHSNHNATLEIIYDKDSLEKYWKGKSYIPFLESQVMKSGGTFISLDTINLIGKVKLLPNDEFVLESGIGKGPDFDLIEKISIISNTTIVLDSKEKMKNAFIEKPGKVEFEIK
jgi:hypothetical protein